MSKDNGNPVQTEDAEPKVEELINQVSDNPDKIDELDPETRKNLLLEIGKMEEDGEPDPEQEPPKVDPKPEDKPEESTEEPDKEAGEEKVEKSAA